MAAPADLPAKRGQIEDRLSAIEKRLEFSGGGGTSDGMEPRVAKLEAHAEHVIRELGEARSDVKELRRDLATDFRILFGAIITLALLTFGGFVWINEKLISLID